MVRASLPPAFYIIPGFRESAAGPRYAWLRRALRERGFAPVPVPITWDRRVMSDYVVEALRWIRADGRAPAYVLGFSYGAVIALSTANALRPARVFLCSLSPDFQEDLPAMQPWIRRFLGARRLEDARTRSGRRLARALTVPATVFYGAREAAQYPQLGLRCEETARLAPRGRVVVIPDCPHRIDHPAYRQALLDALPRA